MPPTRRPATKRRKPLRPRGPQSQGRRRSRPPAAKPIAADESSAGPERLQKVMAGAGIASRRDCEAMILEGRVEIDRKVVTKLGVRVEPQEQEVRVDGVVLKRPKLHYYMVHKPIGVVSTNRDPSGRPRAVDLLPPSVGRVYTIGRLDMNSEGLILLTNDGELAQHLTHPKYGVDKVYQVLVAGNPDRDVLRQVERGIHLSDGFARVTGLKVKRHFKQSTQLEMILQEGRNREIRRLLARVGHKVMRLKRIAVGPVRLGDLPPGSYRPLRTDEVRRLQRQTRRRGKAS